MKIRILLTSVCLLFISQTAVAVDAANGKKIYEARCHGCHDSHIHTRPNRIIHTYDDLLARVKFCDNAAATKFTDAEILDVVEHLNKTYYKFVKEK